MTHEETFLLMMDALDGLLTPPDKDRLDAHLALCTRCYAEWQALQLVDNLLFSAPPVVAPAGFSQRVLAGLEAPSWKRMLGALFALGLGSVAALMVVAAPAALALLGVWTAYNQPAYFSELLIWLNRLAGVSGSLLDMLGTTLRLFFVQVAGNPVVLGWALAAGLAVGLWAHLMRPPSLTHVRNG